MVLNQHRIEVNSSRLNQLLASDDSSIDDVLHRVNLLIQESSGDMELTSVEQADIQKYMLPAIAVDPSQGTQGLVSRVLADNSVLVEWDHGEQGIINALTTTSDVQFIGVVNANRDRRKLGWFNLKTESVALRFLVDEIQANKRVIGEAVFATFVISSLGLFTAMYTMQVYDRVVPNDGLDTLWVLTIGVAIAIGFEFILKQVRSYLVDTTAKSIDQSLASKLFTRAMDIRLDKRPKTIGTFASQLKQFDSVRNFMTSSTLFVLADLPFALLFIFIIYLIAGPVALVPLVVIPLALFVGLSFRGPIGRLTSAHMAETNQKNGLLIEAIDGVETLKSLGGEWMFSEKYNRLTAQIADSEIELRLVSVKATHLAQLLQQVNYILLIAVGAFVIIDGALTVGGLIACSIISGRALGPLAQIPGLMVQWKHAQIALGVLDSLLSLPQEHESNSQRIIPNSCGPLIEFKNVTHGYVEDACVLNIPQFTIRPGEKIAVVGPVGSGKSTFLKVLSGLYQPSSGLVCLDGIDMSQISTEFVRDHIVYLPQDVRLFNGTLRENLVMGIGFVDDQRIFEIAARVGLDQLINSSPSGLDLEILEGGRGVSIGQKQLIGIARLFLKSPSLMLLDEPTASMCSSSESKTIQHLFSEDASSTVVVVTHKTAILPFVDRIIVIDKGQIVLDGDRQAVMDKLRQKTSGAVA